MDARLRGFARRVNSLKRAKRLFAVARVAVMRESVYPIAARASKTTQFGGRIADHRLVSALSIASVT